MVNVGQTKPNINFMTGARPVAAALLYAGNVDGFCLVSSDSDFTRLARRTVIGARMN